MLLQPEYLHQNTVCVFPGKKKQHVLPLHGHRGARSIGNIATKQLELDKATAHRDRNTELKVPCNKKLVCRTQNAPVGNSISLGPSGLFTHILQKYRIVFYYTNMKQNCVWFVWMGWGCICIHISIPTLAPRSTFTEITPLISNHINCVISEVIATPCPNNWFHNDNLDETRHKYGW